MSASAYRLFIITWGREFLPAPVLVFCLAAFSQRNLSEEIGIYLRRRGILSCPFRTPFSPCKIWDNPALYLLGRDSVQVSWNTCVYPYAFSLTGVGNLWCSIKERKKWKKVKKRGIPQLWKKTNRNGRRGGGHKALSLSKLNYLVFPKIACYL